MDTTKFTMGIVGLVVIILMVTGAVLPAVQDAQNQQITELNNSEYRYISSSTLDFVLTYDEDTKTPLINGNPVEGIDFDNPQYHIYVITDKFLARSYLYEGSYVNWNVFSSEVLTGDVYAKTDVSVESVSGVVTIKDSSDNVVLSTTITTALIPSASGSYGAFNPSSSRVLHADSNALIYGVDFAGSGFFLAKTDPTAKNPLTMNVVFALENGSIVDTGTKTLTGTHITDNGSDYYNIESSAGGVFPVVFAPISYHVVTDEDSQLRALFGIIPLLLIIVAVLYAVRLMGASRN